MDLSIMLNIQLLFKLSAILLEMYCATGVLCLISLKYVYAQFGNFSISLFMLEITGFNHISDFKLLIIL